MIQKIKKVLPWVAVICLAVVFLTLMATCFGFVMAQTPVANIHVEDRENRLSVENSLKDLLETPIKNLEAPELLQAFDKLTDQPYIATVWLFDAEGNILKASGSSARSAAEGNVSDLATRETREVLSSISADALPDEQRTMLLAASAIQREGDHNDIYNHMVRTLHTPDGENLGYIGIAYEINPSISDPGGMYKLGILLFVISLIVYWCSLPLWVYLDAKQRNEKAWLWCIFVLAGNFMALLAYLIVRESKTRG